MFHVNGNINFLLEKVGRRRSPQMNFGLMSLRFHVLHQFIDQWFEQVAICAFVHDLPGLRTSHADYSRAKVPRGLREGRVVGS